MKKMNLPNKITVVRIALAVIILILLVFPWYQLNLSFPVYSVMGVEISYFRSFILNCFCN